MMLVVVVIIVVVVVVVVVVTLTTSRKMANELVEKCLGPKSGQSGLYRLVVGG